VRGELGVVREVQGDWVIVRFWRGGTQRLAMTEFKQR
jgi:hypothetical protein